MSAKKEYVKLWLSYETYFQAYTPEEIGNLVLAMLRYKNTGEAPVFQGSERFIWPAVRRDIDEACEAQEAAADRARENGKNGGRPRKIPAESQADENLAGFSETRKTIRTKDKDIDKGHSQGQGHTGEGRQWAAASGRRPAAREKNRPITEAERAAGCQQDFDRMDRFLLQLRAEMDAAGDTAGRPYDAQHAASASQMACGSNSSRVSARNST